MEDYDECDDRELIMENERDRYLEWCKGKDDQIARLLHNKKSVREIFLQKTKLKINFKNS